VIERVGEQLDVETTVWALGRRPEVFTDALGGSGTV
jgi:hypothetical protein